MLSDGEFLERFDAGTLDAAAFDHEAHVRAAWLCLQDDAMPQALARVRHGLKRLAQSAGQPLRYHETITVAYVRLIHRQMRLLGDTTWEEFRTRSPDLLRGDLGAVRALYDAGVLDTAEARHDFVPPHGWDAELPEHHTPEPSCVTAVLTVTDVAESARWYTAAFGFDVSPFPERSPYQFALLSRGHAELMLRAAARAADVAPPAGWSLYVRLPGGQIDGLYAALAGQEDVVRPLERMPYGDVEFEVRDPDGYVIVVSERRGP